MFAHLKTYVTCRVSTASVCTHNEIAWSKLGKGLQILLMVSSIPIPAYVQHQAAFGSDGVHVMSASGSCLSFLHHPKCIDNATDSVCWQAQVDLTKQWRGEKDDMERLQSVKEEIDRVNLEIQGAERDYDLNRAAELKYGTLMDLQKQLKDAEVALEKQVGKFALAKQACSACHVQAWR